MKKVICPIIAAMLSVFIIFTSVGAASVDNFGYKNADNSDMQYLVPGQMSAEADITGGSGDTTAKLLTAVYDDESGELINAAFSETADISDGKSGKVTASLDIESIDGVAVKNYLWDSLGGIKPLVPSKIVPIKLSVAERNGFRVLLWDTDGTADGMTYSVYADGEEIASGIGAQKGSYTDETPRTSAASYQVKSYINGIANGASNIVISEPKAKPVMPEKPDSSLSQTGNISEWSFDASKTISSDNGYKFTDSALMIADGANWAVTDSDYLYDKTASAYNEKSLDENAIVLYRQTTDSDLVIVFGDEIKKGKKATISFDFDGSRQSQTGSMIYTFGGAEKTAELRVSGKYKNYSFEADTDNDLTDYGFPGKSGAVIRYKKAAKPAKDSFWIKNLTVTEVDTICATITADSAAAGYGDISPAGNRLDSTVGDSIAGNVLRTSSGEWHYGIGYDYRNVNGTDAFYLTQLYDTSGSNSAYPSTKPTKSLLGFKVNADGFAKSPSTVSGAYVSITYYDGVSGDITTAPFNVYVSTDSKSYDSSSPIASINMAGGNTWKTVSFAIPDGAAAFSNGNPLGTDISFRAAESSGALNKKGILIKSVSVMDTAFYNTVYKDWEKYYSDYAEYEKNIAELENKGALKFPNGVSIDFNKDADGTIKRTEWEDVSRTGLAFCADSGNMPETDAYRSFSYYQYGPESDRRYAVSTASYIDQRKAAGKQTYLYFKADGEYINNDAQYVEVEITFLDSSTDTMRLMIKPSAGANYTSVKLPQTNTGVWKKAIFRADKAVFEKNDEKFCGDFRLTLDTDKENPNQLIVSDITVRNLCGKTQAEKVINKTPTIYIAGDSIAADYTNYTGGRPQDGTRYGWGEKLSFSNAKIDNRAVPGQSTRVFKFDNIINELSKNDYVFISFGHNDSTESKTNIYVDVEGYKNNIRTVVNKVLAKGATPVVITSLPTYRWGKIELDYVYEKEDVATPSPIAPYRKAAMEAADELNILGFDLGTAFANELAALESDDARYGYYVYEGYGRRVHLSEEGAQCAADLIENAVKSSSKIRRLK